MPPITHSTARAALWPLALVAALAACDDRATPTAPQRAELRQELTHAAATPYGPDTLPNPVKTENAKPGTAGWQLSNPALRHEIEGYASSTSVNRGASIDLFVNTTDASYGVNVYRMGWYGGAGAREVFARAGLAGTVQPAPLYDDATRTVSAANWTPSLTLNVPLSGDPTDWASGAYLVKLTGSGGKQSYVPFTVRDDARASSFVFKSSVNTWQAYNSWGGYSLYTGARAYKVSYDRPYWYKGSGGSGVGAGDFLTMNADSAYPASHAAWEYNMVRFLEREGYDVTYVTDVDLHEDASRVLNHKALLSVGHDEYWSGEERTNLETLRDGGRGLAFFGGDVGGWQVRLEPGATGRASRTMVGYKADAMRLDPFALDGDAGNDRFITTRFENAPVNRPERTLVGVGGTEDAIDGDMVVSDASLWPFAGANLANGSRIVGVLGYEVGAVGAGTPPGAVTLAHSPYTSKWGVSGYADMITYAAPSGATVFSAGSVQWAWGLDDFNAPALRAPVASAAAQQVARNVLGRIAGFAAAPPPNETVPAAPSGLAASLAGATQANLAWTDRSGNETGFRVERAQGAGAFAVVATVGANVTRYSNAGLARKTSYAYRVSAVNGAGASAASNTASVTTK